MANLKPILTNIKTLAAYYPKDDEFDVLPILKSFKHVCLPYLTPNAQILQFKEWHSLRPGPFGVMQPEQTAPDVIPDALLIPLLAVDKQGNRIGYGKGHYDATIHHLKQIKEVLLIGVCYDVQIIEAVPHQEHDEALDYIVTEKNIYKCKT